MNKDIEKIDLSNHNISVISRQSINISGVSKINSFDSEEFLLETSMGPLGIKGRELEIVKLDTYDGNILIKGIIDGFTYLDNTKKKKEDTVVARLFK